jgi:hypothetical protein
MNKHIRMAALAAGLVAGLGLLAAAAPAQAADGAGMFGRGGLQIGVVAGGATAFNTNYTIIGAGVNYYVVDGLGLGLAYESWSGTGPHISKLTPSVQYVFYQLGRVKPYVGAFYRRITVSGQPDYDSAGGRLGVYVALSPHAALGAGYARETALNCQRSIYSSCSTTYAEISLVVGF